MYTTTVSKTNVLHEWFFQSIVHVYLLLTNVNGPQFIAEEFDKFTICNGIKCEECAISSSISQKVHPVTETEFEHIC